MKRAALAVLAATLIPVAARAGTHDHHSHHVEPTPAPVAEKGTLARTTLTDHRGQALTLPDGKVWVVTFFYGSCKAVCPTLLYNLSQVEKRLPVAWKDQVGLLAVSFDPEVDQPAKLKAVATDMGLNQPQAHLVTGTPMALKTVFEAFHFSYKPDPAGGYQHANLLAVMDRQGNVRKHFYGLNPPLDQVIKTLERSR